MIEGVGKRARATRKTFIGDVLEVVFPIFSSLPTYLGHNVDHAKAE